eukprot:6492026-Amphidinium_carterae.1
MSRASHRWVPQSMETFPQRCAWQWRTSRSGAARCGNSFLFQVTHSTATWVNGASERRVKHENMSIVVVKMSCRRSGLGMMGIDCLGEMNALSDTCAGRSLGYAGSTTLVYGSSTLASHCIQRPLGSEKVKLLNCTSSRIFEYVFNLPFKKLCTGGVLDRGAQVAMSMLLWCGILFKWAHVAVEAQR